MSITCRSISLALQKEGLPVTLYKGNGYLYFDFWVEASSDRPAVYETHSVYTCRLNDMPRGWWLKEGREFAARVFAEQ